MRRTALGSRRAALISAALATVSAAVWLAVDPPSSDLAAHLYRAQLFSAHPFALWDGQWYAGHLLPAYSVLFPPLAAAVGPQLVGALSAPVTAAGFALLCEGRFGAPGRWAAYWFSLATLSELLSGRLPFAAGLAAACWALVALAAGRRGWAVTLAVVAALLSPVAALFLALGGGAWWLAGAGGWGRGPRWALAVVAAALVPVAALAVVFPEGGAEPYGFASFWHATLAGSAVAAAAWWGRRRSRVLMAGGALAAAMCIAAYVTDTPLGGNTSRLSALLAGPLLLALLWGERRRTVGLVLLAVPAIWFQWADAVRDIRKSAGDPSISAAYYAPLLGFLDRQGGRPFRIEIAFTLNHYEATQVAPRYALARGWERQLDEGDNGLFYHGRLGPDAYAAWLRSTGVRFVALPDVRLDPSATQEARLLRAGRIADLRPAFTSAHWTVWEVPGVRLVRGPGRMTALGIDHFSLTATAPGRLLVAERFSPYWALGSGSGCVARGPQGWTQVTARTAGPLTVVTRFSALRILDRGPRCTA